ncbi:PH (Pleckstrin Homology) domain-containing protein [Krasilnikovia cinnamomea]|uniref:PH (Pleckstrin Homology) domain-containing protein n=1 Tax=Krasilnikovia cinnamomea TaxID=349313 RepID=A0A4Q7ZGT0_9ACTN|nr:PH domain-containing protein [Krasilnikovia cinnamomea]RZU49571.1 PH (Pleckstrin Homology) domain-containing protein [Krasilnikovia cinnamomea]
MDAAFAGVPARFRPTWQQALGHGLYVGGVMSVVGVAGGLLAAVAGLHWAAVPAPPSWVWLLLAVGPPLVAVPIGLLVGRRQAVVVDADGIRTVAPFTRVVEPWSRVVDLRAERRGGRTVVSVYLDTGASVQLCAPYSGEMFAADPQFELKVGALSHLWRSHRFGGVPC